MGARLWPGGTEGSVDSFIHRQPIVRLESRADGGGTNPGQHGQRHEAHALRGCAVSTIPELLWNPQRFCICDRLAVMARGRLSELKPITQWTPESIMALATTGISA